MKPSLTALVLPLVALLAAACGGTIETERDVPSSPTAPLPRGDAPPPGGAAAPACQPRPGPDVANGIASCDVARTSFSVEVLGLTWIEPSLAWEAGGRARFDIRYTNSSETRSIHYPGMLVASSDPRAQTDTEAHGDGVVHPDLYALAACKVSMSRDHGFEVHSKIPSGTQLIFTMSPAVATGDDISSCDGTLTKTTLTVTVP